MAEANPGPSSSSGRETSSKFFNRFVNGRLSKHPEARFLVKLKEDNGRRFLRFNDVNKITLTYCDYKEENGKVLDRNPKKRKDNFKNTIALSEKDGHLKKVGFGTEFEKEYLKYEIKDEQLWQSLKRNYSVPRNSHTTRENFSARQDGPFSDTSGIVTTQSDDCVGNERKFRESLQWPREASSDTGDVSLSSLPDDHLVDEPYFSLGETDKFEASFITGVSDDLSKEFLFDELVLHDELDQYLPQKKVVNQMCPEKLTITPNFSYIEGGSTFIVRAAWELQSGIYQVSFGPYGICKAYASGDGTKWLQGMDKIPKAQRSGTHSVTVQVWDENRRHIGNFPFTYKDINADAVMQELASESPTSFGQWSPRNEPDRATRTFSGESIDQEVRNKKMKSCPIDMPMLMYFCDEMAKRGDEDFFRALIGLGILADVLANPNEYFNSFAVTAREHGHGELAELIAMSSREQSYDSWMEKLTLGTLVDAVRTERSLANLVNSPDNDSDSCSSCYDGDCDSEDDAFCSDVGSDGDDDDDDDDDDNDDDGPCSRIIPQEETAKETEATKSFSSTEEVNHIAVKREITELWIKSEQHPTTSAYKKSITFDAITELNDTYEQEQKTDLPSWEISRTGSRLVVLGNVLGGGHFVAVKTLKVLLLLAMEFCPGGNIKELLSNSKINDEYKNIYCKFTERQLINFAAEIARGMQFLFENKIVYRGIACRDVLLDVQLVPKIADFGLARKIDDSAHYIVNKNRLLPLKWMSIESLAEGVFTAASYTLSYGILLSKICTLGSPRSSLVFEACPIEWLRRENGIERLRRKLEVEQVSNKIAGSNSAKISFEEQRKREFELVNLLSENDSTGSWEWRRTSQKHRDKFEKLHEFGKKSPDVRICCDKEFLKGGSDGTRVYVGLSKDGGERAVKRLVGDDDICSSLAEHEKEILNERNAIMSNHVVKYRFLDKSNKDWLYLIMDLYEETLEDIVQHSSRDELLKIGQHIIQQILRGLADIHHDPRSILHRDLKPSNILRDVDGNWLLGDFGISRILTPGKSTCLTKQKGTDHWRAVESCLNYASDIVEVEVRYKKESNVQVAGMMAFYVLTKGKHPFGEEPDQLRNVLDGKPANDLISWMLSHEPKDRPLAEEALKHPYLASPEQLFKMLCEVANQREIKKGDVDLDVVRKLKAIPGDWQKQIDSKVLNYLRIDFVTGKPHKYGPSWCECLRLIRNVNQHWYDISRQRPQPDEEFYLVDNPQKYFLNVFPNLPTDVHRIVRSSDWKERPNI